LIKSNTLNQTLQSKGFLDTLIIFNIWAILDAICAKPKLKASLKTN